ncbi:MAG TPA: hypothetical protein VFF13_03155 [archaeon]|nr:hypothetical protein [archaeon]
MDAEKEKQDSPITKNNGFNPVLLIVVVVLVGAITFLLINNSNSTQGLAILPGETQTIADSEIQTDATQIDSVETTASSEDLTVSPSSFPVRQRYFEETFKPKRESYDLFKKAAEHLNIPIEKVPEYFSLNSESEVFNELPPIPTDFSEIAFLLATGRTYSIGLLSEGYYMQPEFYPGFKESGIKYWTEPDPKYWATNGYGSYPADQADILSKSGRDEFTAVVFFYTGYGVQTYQGTTIIPTSESLEHFDIQVTPDTFLLTPTFPKFTSDWVQQIIITGKLKPNTPPGDYSIGFLITTPPIDKKQEWEFKYRNLYFDTVNSIAPSRFPFAFNITVQK